MDLKRLLSGKTQETPNLISPEDAEILVRVAEREKAIRAFFSTPVGKYIEERINRDQEDAKAELLSVDAYDIKTIRKIQEKAQQARRLEVYLGEALIDGAQAQHILNQTRGFVNGEE